MNAIDLLTSRVSTGAFGEPGPDDAVLAKIFDAAMRAPDHGKLRPWRFLVIRGEARNAFADVLVDSLKKRDPTAAGNESLLKKEREKPLRAPVIVAVIAAVQQDHPKIPAIEQTLAVGAAAGNMMLAANALGYGAAWKTGEPAYDPAVKAALGIKPSDEVIGYIYLGTSRLVAPPAPAPDHRRFVAEWTGPGKQTAPPGPAV